MAVRVNIDQAKLLVKIDNACESVISIMAGEILADCNQYCKEDTGMLIASSLIHSQLKDGLLIWWTPYARRQYYEIKTAFKDVNPKATWKWCDAAKAKHQKEWTKKAQYLIGKLI